MHAWNTFPAKRHTHMHTYHPHIHIFTCTACKTIHTRGHTHTHTHLHTHTFTCVHARTHASNTFPARVQPTPRRGPYSNRHICVAPHQPGHYVVIDYISIYAWMHIYMNIYI